MATNWSDTLLDEMRQVGDPLADDVVTSLFQSSGVYAVGELMKTLVTNDHPAPDQLPAQLKTYLEITSRIPQLDPGSAAAGEHLFATFGPEMMVVLLCYSLPACYADQKGVQVLYRSGYLNNRVNRRVFETAQMVIDVVDARRSGPRRQWRPIGAKGPPDACRRALADPQQSGSRVGSDVRISHQSGRSRFHPDDLRLHYPGWIGQARSS